ncbi:MAG: DUF2442 domain-containing protein [Desulfobacterales bacterium]
MTILAVEMDIPYAENIMVTADTLTVDLSDGRTISVPLAWYPRLMHATPEELKNWRLIGKGQGVHWEDIDEDISIEGLLIGRPSGESQASFKKWLQTRKSRPTSKRSS